MLARRLTPILPEMTLAEAIATTRMHRVAGLTGARTAFVTTRPFRAPHHPISAVGLSGGSQVPQPGEVSLARHGVLVLDELPEFRRHVLEVLRQPLEAGSLEAPLLGRPGSLRVGGLRRPHNHRKGGRYRTIATEHLRGDHYPRGVTTSSLRTRRHPVLFA
jgi:hypothetical protein